MYNCKYCNSIYEKTSSLAAHSKWCKSNPNRQIPFESINCKSEKRKEINHRINTDKFLIEKRRNTLKDSYDTGKIKKPKGIASSDIKEQLRKNKISNTMKLNPNAGGLRKGSGRGIKGTYKGFYCDSTWELAWVIFQLEHNQIFVRNIEGFEYEFNGRIHKYYPDFKIDDVYYEIKGRRSFKDLDDKTKIKILSFKYELKVLYLDEMTNILNYVINKYGYDFYSLYE